MGFIFGYIKKLNSTEENIENFLHSSCNRFFSEDKNLTVAVKTGPLYDCSTINNEKEAKICLSNLKNNEAMFCIVNKYEDSASIKYPLEIENNLFVIDGGISLKKFEELKLKHNDLKSNSFSMYVFKELKENFIQWHLFDDIESDFVGWWLHTNSILVQFFNKKQPLFFKYTKEVIYFSSFQEDADFKLLENNVKVINLETYQEKNYYKFKNNIERK